MLSPALVAQRAVDYIGVDNLVDSRHAVDYPNSHRPHFFDYHEIGVGPQSSVVHCFHLEPRHLALMNWYYVGCEAADYSLGCPQHPQVAHYSEEVY